MRRLGWMVILLLVPGAVSRGAETATEVEARLAERYAKLKSFRAHMRTFQALTQPNGDMVKAESEGTVELLKHEGKILYRSEAKDSAVQKQGGREEKSESQSLMISDGEFFYALADQEGQKTVIKQRPDPVLGVDAKTMLDKMRGDHEIKLGAEQVFDGEECYVFEVYPKKPEENPSMGKTMLFFQKNTGIRVQSLGVDPTGKPVFMSFMKDVKTNVDLSPDRFKFKMPPDAQLMDLTKGN